MKPVKASPCVCNCWVCRGVTWRDMWGLLAPRKGSK